MYNYDILILRYCDTSSAYVRVNINLYISCVNNLKNELLNHSNIDVHFPSLETISYPGNNG